MYINPEIAQTEPAHPTTPEAALLVAEEALLKVPDSALLIAEYPEAEKLYSEFCNQYAGDIRKPGRPFPPIWRQRGDTVLEYNDEALATSSYTREGYLVHVRHLSRREGIRVEPPALEYFVVTANLHSRRIPQEWRVDEVQRKTDDAGLLTTELLLTAGESSASIRSVPEFAGKSLLERVIVCRAFETALKEAEGATQARIPRIISNSQGRYLKPPGNYQPQMLAPISELAYGIDKAKAVKQQYEEDLARIAEGLDVAA